MEAGSWRALPPGAMRKALKAERGAGGSGKAALMLLACLFRRQEMAGTATALVLFQSPSAACDRLARMHRGGLDALRDQAKPGRPPKIDPNLYGDISGHDRQAAGGVRHTVKRVDRQADYNHALPEIRDKERLPQHSITA